MITTAHKASDWTTEMQLLELSTATSRTALQTPTLLPKGGRRGFPQDETGCSVKQNLIFHPVLFSVYSTTRSILQTLYFQIVEHWLDGTYLHIYRINICLT